jgi:hypothetical protein
MATRAEQLTELQAERTRIKTAITTALSGNSSESFESMSITRWRLDELRKELIRVEKSIQRLCRGGRGMPIDMSIGQSGSTTAFDPLTGEALYG